MWFLPQASSKAYAFVDTNVESNIEYAFQALALDERRGPFTPTIWAAPTNAPKELKQCWFRGVHSDIGGGYPDHELGNLSLAWMMTQLESKSLIQFDHATFWKLIESSARAQVVNRSGPQAMLKLKSWGLGQIHDSMQWYYRLLTRPRIREPRSFTQTQLNPPWWKQMLGIFLAPKSGLPLEHTHECIHSSVGKRQTVEATPCAALRKWSYDGSAKAWSKPGVESLREDELQGLEMELAQRWDDIVDRASRHAASH